VFDFQAKLTGIGGPENRYGIFFDDRLLEPTAEIAFEETTLGDQLET
jgi:hypothetical protein